MADKLINREASIVLPLGIDFREAHFKLSAMDQITRKALILLAPKMIPDLKND